MIGGLIVFDAVNDFILAFLPDMPQDGIYRGYSNRMALPANNEYIIYSIASTLRVGTDVLTYEKAGEQVITVKAFRQYAVDVDICSADRQTAQTRATTLETIGRCYLAVDFFKARGIDFDYCDDVQYLPFTDDTEQYVERYRVTLHLARWETVTVPQEYAERVVAKVVNIDTMNMEENQ